MDWLDRLEEVDAATRRRPFRPFRHAGLCPACRQEVVFVATGPWLRDEYVCEACASIPRERALAGVYRRLVGSRAGLVVHESSPSGRGFSLWLARHCPGLIASHYWGPERRGEAVNGYRNEDLSALTFADASIDVHITQDVLEHVFDIDAVAREIRRTLKPGGMHIFTTPMVNKDRPTVQRAVMDGGWVRHLVEPPAYHGNPISAEGSLVTYDFGFDMVARLDAASGTRSDMVTLDDLRYGIRAEYIEVVVSRRGAAGIAPGGTLPA
ncbi:methyltransferase [Allostella sp. ATCC 35155]|nr:methyltransferase [Stella sp. ATCC 35155]